MISILVFDLECVSVVEKSVALVVVTKGVNKGLVGYTVDARHWRTRYSIMLNYYAELVQIMVMDVVIKRKRCNCIGPVRKFTFGTPY